MAHRVALAIALRLDGQPVSSDTRYTTAGAAVAVLQTTIPRPDIASSLHSTYSGHPGLDTTSTHLWLAPHNDLSTTFEHHDGDRLSPCGPHTQLVLDHLLVLHAPARRRRPHRAGRNVHARAPRPRRLTDAPPPQAPARHAPPRRCRAFRAAPVPGSSTALEFQQPAVRWRHEDPRRCGAAVNGGVAALALRRYGRGEAGLRWATRATGQAALLPFACWFATGDRRALIAAAGTHAVHAPVLAALIARHGHPARGTPVLPMSVGGGILGYLALLALLRADRPLPLADWYLFGFVHGLPIPHAWATKPGGGRVYAPLAVAWVLAAAARVARR